MHGRSTIEAILYIIRLLKIYLEIQNDDFHMKFIDLERVYDKVSEKNDGCLRETRSYKIYECHKTMCTKERSQVQEQ